MALSLSSVIKWILCLIGGIPLLQLVAHTFNDFPIPFAKVGKFPPESIKKLIEKIKKLKEDAENFDINKVIKENFSLPADIKTGLEVAEQRIKDVVGDPLADPPKEGSLAKSAPFLFSRTGDVAVARDKLMAKIGDINNYASQKNWLGTSLKQWSEIGNDGTFAGAFLGFTGHVKEISGLLSDDKVLRLQAIPGYPVVGYANTSTGSNVVSINLNASAYPVTNIGSSIVIANVEYVVVNKVHTQTNAYVTLNANSTIIQSSNYLTYNLANIAMATSSSLKIKPGLSITVNNKTARINTINALGDYMTVYRPITFANSNCRVSVETSLIANSNIASNTSNGAVKLELYGHGSSICLGDVIYGNSTSFLSHFAVGERVYYDEKEYDIVSLTNTEIVVNDRLKGLSGEFVYKILQEANVERTAELNGPDEILASFSVAEQMSAGLGDNFVEGITTRYKKADGSYATIDAWKPIHVTRSVQDPGAALVNKVTEIVQNLIDDLKDDLIAQLEENELVLYIEAKEQEFETLRQNFKDIVEADKAAINQIKSLVKGLLKLFKISCSKKKRGDDPEDPDLSSDEYLQLILVPNPERVGCEATEPDFIDLIDDSDDEYNTVPLPEPRDDSPYDPGIDLDQLTQPDLALYGLELPGVGGGNGDITIDQTPDSLLPPDTPDPCTEPC